MLDNELGYISFLEKLSLNFEKIDALLIRLVAKIKPYVLCYTISYESKI